MKKSTLSMEDMDMYESKIHEKEVDPKLGLLYQYKVGYMILIEVSIIIACSCAWTDLMFALIDLYDNVPPEDTPYLKAIIYFMDYVYFVDIIQRVWYKLLKWRDQYVFDEPAIKESLIADIVSILPYESIYTNIEPNTTVGIALRLRVVIRIVRYYSIRRLIFQRIKVNNMQFFTLRRCWVEFLSVLLLAGLHAIIYCRRWSCSHQDFEQLLIFTYKCYVYMLRRGIELFVIRNVYMDNTYAVVNLINHLCILMYTAKYISIKIEYMNIYYNLINSTAMTRNTINKWQDDYRHNWSFEDDRIIHAVSEYYQNVYRYRNGISKEHGIYNTIPECLEKTIRLDSSIDALKHSHLFRKLEPHIYLYLSNLMVSEFAVPGQIIIKKGDFKSKMIYIKHGVLQILSQEDCETPVLNLSGGSCWGEISLYVQCPSPCTIICQSFCELVVLELRSFRLIISKYPEHYKSFKKTIIERIVVSKQLRKVATEYIQKEKIKKDNILILGWIKSFQRQILNEQSESENIIDIETLDKYIENCVFYIIHLDKLVISDDIELVSDKVFLKSSCQFILQPHSALLFFWRLVFLSIIVCYISFYPIILGFVHELNDVYIAIDKIILLIYICEIYLKVVTAVNVHGITLSTPMAILSYRLKTTDFILDLISIIPFEFLAYNIIGNPSMFLFTILQANRLLQYYRIEQAINLLVSIKQNWMHVSITLKYVIHGCFLVYYVTIIIYILNCPLSKCDKIYKSYLTSTESIDNFEKVVSTASYSLSLLYGIYFGSYPYLEASYYYIFIYIFFLFISIYFYTLFLVDVVASSAIVHQKELILQESLSNINKVIKSYKLDKQFYNKVNKYLVNLWYFRTNIDLTYIDSDLPRDLAVCYKNIKFMRLFTKNPAFMHLPRKMLFELCYFVDEKIIPANQNLCYGGEEMKNIFIIINGYCNRSDSDRSNTIGAPENIGLLEFFCNVPYKHTVTTITDCLIFQIPVNNFRRYLTEFMQVEFILQSSIQYVLNKPVIENTSIINPDKILEKTISNVSFPLVRQLTLFSTNGWFLFYWTIFRCICIYLNAIISSAASAYDSFLTNIILYCLDITAVVDIVLRCFVSYYDSTGMEIFYFKKTFQYYLWHAFAVDLLGTIPFDLIIVNETVLYTRLNRFLLLYRLRGFFDYISDRIEKISFVKYTSVLLIFTCFVVYLAGLYLHLTCNAKDNDAEYFLFDNIKCDIYTWPTLSRLPRPTSKNHLYFSCIMLFISSFLHNGFTRFVLGHYMERFCFNMWTLAGIFIKVIIVGKATSLSLFKNADLTNYQSEMNKLVKFLSYCKIDNAVKTEVIDYFEHIWTKRQHVDVRFVIKQFPNTLQEDILYNIYEPQLNTGIFEYADPPMIKNLLLVSKHQHIRTTGILYRVNDVHGVIFYLLKGSVEVVGPDERSLTVLYQGSMFGCLDRCILNRQTLMMVAKGHIQILMFKSKLFHQIISKYPRFRNKFKHTIKSNVDFIRGQKKPKDPKRSRTSQHHLKVLKKIANKIKPTNSNYEVKLYIIDFTLLTLIELLFHVLIENRLILITLYVRDVLWIIRIYLKFHTAYEDEFGMLVYDRKKIAMRYTDSKIGFYFDLATSFPIDCLAYFISNRNLFAVIFLLLRANRLLRKIHIFIYISKTTNKLNINAQLIRMIRAMMYLKVSMLVAYYILYFTEMYGKYFDDELFYTLVNAAYIMHSIIFIHTTTCVPYNKLFNDQFTPLLVSCIILLNVVFLVYMFINLTSTYQIISMPRMKFLHKAECLESFLHMRGSSAQVIQSVKIYHNFLQRTKSGIQYPSLLDEAPYYLKEAVMNSMFGFHLRNHVIFSDCHVDFLRQLSFYMKPITLFENNHICMHQEIDETMYFIHEGLVHAVTEDAVFVETRKYTLVPGDSFGFKQLFYLRVGHAYTYKTAKLSVLITIKRENMMRLLRFFPASMNHIENKINREHF